MTTNPEPGSGSSGEKIQSGSCHCGKVRFEIAIDVAAGGNRCNCSICSRINDFAAVVKPERFRLLEGEEHLSAYEWGTKISTRFFCKHCGVHCFARGHLADLGGDYVAINLQTLEAIDPNLLKVVYWDGRHDNWDAGSRDTPWPIFRD